METAIRWAVRFMYVVVILLMLATMAGAIILIPAPFIFDHTTASTIAKWTSFCMFIAMLVWVPALCVADTYNITFCDTSRIIPTHEGEDYEQIL